MAGKTCWVPVCCVCFSNIVAQPTENWRFVASQELISLFPTTPVYSGREPSFVMRECIWPKLSFHANTNFVWKIRANIYVTFATADDKKGAAGLDTRGMLCVRPNYPKTHHCKLSKTFL